MPAATAPAFSTSAVTQSAQGARSVHAADLDGDGRLDVLSASVNDDRIAWYRNGGGVPASWTPYNISTTANGAGSVHAADMDGDGRVDVLSASALDKTVAWHRNGGGTPVTWTTHFINVTADGAVSVHAADLDGDGRLDVLSASQTDDKIAWYKNQGGSPVVWTAYVITTTADSARSVHAADVDGDGRLDVLSASFNDSRIAWYRNDGGNPVTWTTHTIITTASGAQSVHAADLDGDGRQDVLSASSLDSKVAWYRNNGGSPVGWTPYVVTTASTGSVVYVTAADVDSDGRVDVLSASTNAGEMAWYKNGAGSPVTWTAYTVSAAADAFFVHAADLNGDGWLDALSSNFNLNQVAVHVSSGLCDPGSAGAPSSCSPCPVGRYADGRGFPTCAPCPAGASSSPSAVSCFACPAGRYSLAGGACLVCAAGQYGAAPNASSCTPCPAGRFSGAAALACQVASLPAAAAPTFSSSTVTPSAQGVRSVHAADVDGDGRLDVVSACYNGGGVAWHRNLGGSPALWASYNVSTALRGAFSVVGVDVDGDGRTVSEVLGRPQGLLGGRDQVLYPCVPRTFCSARCRGKSRRKARSAFPPPFCLHAPSRVLPPAA
jgi:hypothetical protein